MLNELRDDMPVDDAGNPAVAWERLGPVSGSRSYPEHPIGSEVELYGYAALPQQDAIWHVNQTAIDGSLGGFAVARGFLQNPRPIVLQAGNRTIPIGDGLDINWNGSLQLVAVALASIGVANEILAVGVVPVVGLSLAFSFGFYGLVRKKLGADSAVGLGVETVLLLPLAIGFLINQWAAGHGTLARGDPGEVALLAAGGMVTVFPLVCFAAAALKLPLSTLGFFQYIAPSIMFVLAIFVYGEPFRWTQGVTFAFIWLAVLVFSGEAYYVHGRRQLAGRRFRGLRDRSSGFGRDQRRQYEDRGGGLPRPQCGTHPVLRG